MPQEEQDHHRNGEHHLHQRRLEIVYGTPDQFRPVVDGDNFHTLGKSGFNLPYFSLHAFDDIQSVLPLAHDNDSGDDFSRAVQIADASANVRPHHNLSDIFDADRSPVFAGGNSDVLDVADRLHVPAPADHVLGPAKFDQPSP